SHLHNKAAARNLRIYSLLEDEPCLRYRQNIAIEDNPSPITKSFRRAAAAVWFQPQLPNCGAFVAQPPTSFETSGFPTSASVVFGKACFMAEHLAMPAAFKG
ncbi:hypothetical protein Droror1_Dr00028284, partial [Drosera rotundifolia]